MLKRKEYAIYESDNGFIVQNLKMKGFSHTHVQNKNDAMRLIGLSLSKKLPAKLSPYLLRSLLRINIDKNYCERINNMLNSNEPRQRYYNVNKGKVKK